MVEGLLEYLFRTSWFRQHEEPDDFCRQREILLLDRFPPKLVCLRIDVWRTSCPFWFCIFSIFRDFWIGFQWNVNWKSSVLVRPFHGFSKITKTQVCWRWNKRNRLKVQVRAVILVPVRGPNSQWSSRTVQRKITILIYVPPSGIPNTFLCNPLHFLCKHNTSLAGNLKSTFSTSDGPFSKTIGS